MTLTRRRPAPQSCSLAIGGGARVLPGILPNTFPRPKSTQQSVIIVARAPPTTAYYLTEGVGGFAKLVLTSHSPRPLGPSAARHMPSRQERRNAERDAAKQARAGAVGAEGLPWELPLLSRP